MYGRIGSENKALCIFLCSQLFRRGDVVSSLPVTYMVVVVVRVMGAHQAKVRIKANTRCSMHRLHDL
jgi:hypothetical protein